ncbi:MAG: hypothetical protein ACLSVD_02850 [Eggerthellaceae bacterium]
MRIRQARAGRIRGRPARRRGRVDERIAHRDLSAMPDGEIDAYKRAACAACEALADPAASSTPPAACPSASWTPRRCRWTGLSTACSRSAGRILYGPG